VAEVVRERPAITHGERVVDDASGVTKADLADYVVAVAQLVLPYAVRRPLALVRCPTGLAGAHFFQKHAMAGMPDAIRRAHVGREEVLYVEDANGLVALVQHGTVELHGWGSRMPEPDRPDQLVLDLDPAPDVPFDRVVDAALEVREVLRGLGLVTFVKTTGGKGLHVVAPLAPSADWPSLSALARSIALGLERAAPDRYTSVAAKKARHGRIFVDYLRNGMGATAVLPGSPRARAGLPVAWPVGWKELRDVDPSSITVRTAPARLANRRIDPWRDFFELAQPLPRVAHERRGVAPARGRRPRPK
jgi:bifunctional non-homologous end joining protein LigD